MDKKIVKQIVEVFTKEQFAIEIGKVLNNTEIDMWIINAYL